MTTVTQCAIAAMLAATKINGASCLGLVFQWRECGAFMGTVTKRLLFAHAASTPPRDLPSVNLYRVRSLLGDNRHFFGHVFLPWLGGVETVF